MGTWDDSGEGVQLVRCLLDHKLDQQSFLGCLSPALANNHSTCPWALRFKNLREVQGSVHLQQAGRYHYLEFLPKGSGNEGCWNSPP